MKQKYCEEDIDTKTISIMSNASNVVQVPNRGLTLLEDRQIVTILSWNNNLDITTTMYLSCNFSLSIKDTEAKQMGFEHKVLLFAKY